MGRSWDLGDAAAIAAENPYTFYRPSTAALALLAPGNFAKLMFEFTSDDPEAPGAERMWVKILERDGDRFVGVLDNDPGYIADLASGDEVRFEARHVLQVDVADPVPDPTEPFRKRCFVTARVLRDGVKVGFLYREASEADDDSGWRITAGDEPEGYFEDADNVAYVSLGAVLRVDDSVVGLLEHGEPCAFRRDPVSGAFEPTER